MPSKAALSASVAPDVKITSSGRLAPSAREVRMRASSSAANASRPTLWTEFALPNGAWTPACRYGAMACAAQADKGVVAALSR